MSKVTKADLLRALPIPLRNDAGMMKLAETAAKALLKAWSKIESPNIYARIDQLDENMLDQLAKELNIGWYDYEEDLDKKRATIKNSWNVRRVLGTKGAVEGALGDAAEGSYVEEWFEYGGDEFHFRVKIPGMLTQEKIDWIQKAVNLTKSVRSKIDSASFVQEWLHNLFVGCALYTYNHTTYNVAAVEIEDDWYIDENSDMLLDEDGILLIVE